MVFHLLFCYITLWEDFFFLIYSLLWVFGCTGSSLLGMGFLLLQCSGFSAAASLCCGARALGAWASVVGGSVALEQGKASSCGTWA